MASWRPPRELFSCLHDNLVCMWGVETFANRRKSIFELTCAGNGKSGGLGDMNGNVLSLLTNSCKELLFCLKSRPLVAVQTGEKTWREGKGAFRDRAREQVRGQRTPGHTVTSVRVKRTPSHISQVTMRTSQSRSGQTLSHISQVTMRTSCILK